VPDKIRIPPGLTASYLVFDRDTGAVTLSADEHRRIRSASLVKLMIALDYLDQHGAANPTNPIPELESMLRFSDDDAASKLWIEGGFEEIVKRVVAKLSLHDTSPPLPADRGWWGHTATSAADIVLVYRYILDCASFPVRRFIMSNLHHAMPCADDGFNQFFGIPCVIPGAAYKQGWSNFGQPRNPCRQPKRRPRAEPGVGKDGPRDRVRELNNDVDLIRPAMHTSGTYANDRKIAALLTLQPNNTDWDTSVGHVTQIARDMYKRAESRSAAE
jgi:hypothetical protein